MQDRAVFLDVRVLFKRSSQIVEQLRAAWVGLPLGNPAEMLGLEMELDADLGIDSIKRVEIFSVLQEKLPNAPVIKPEHLGSLRTLRDTWGTGCE